MRPREHPRYDFAENRYTLHLMYPDGKKRRKRVGSIRIGIVNDRRVDLLEMYKEDWLCGEALKEAEKLAHGAR